MFKINDKLNGINYKIDTIIDMMERLNKRMDLIENKLDVFMMSMRSKKNQSNTYEHKK